MGYKYNCAIGVLSNYQIVKNYSLNLNYNNYRIKNGYFYKSNNGNIYSCNNGNNKCLNNNNKLFKKYNYKSKDTIQIIIWNEKIYFYKNKFLIFNYEINSDKEINYYPTIWISDKLGKFHFKILE